MTTKDEVKEEIQTRLMYACPNIDFTYAINSMVDLFSHSRSRTIDECLEEVAVFRKNTLAALDGFSPDGIDRYNQALSDLTASLTKLKELQDK